MAANILELPFRRSHTVEFSSAIKQYISSKYDQHPGIFTDDLRLIDHLRADAVSIQEPHISGIVRLQRYAAQLRYIGGKFPIDIGVDFPWYPALGYHKDKAVLQNNIRFELANILYNLAALYSQLAYNGNRTTSEGLKTAAQYGVAAAGTLSFLQTEVIPDMRASLPEDMEEMTLQSLEQLCLAQAQECYWQKAVKDEMKDGTIARLAAKVSDYYAAAGDAAVKSDAISTEWIHHFQAKHHHFAGAAQYRQSRDCLEKRKYGEEVARLRDSVICVNEALKQSRWINRVVLGDLNGLKTRVTEDLKRAEKDNDLIYLLPVPPKSELKVLDRANMVSAKAPKEVADAISMLGADKPFGKPLFEKLVPYAVHQAASIYADRRDRLVTSSIIADIEAMTLKIHSVLQSLNLPGSLQALEKPLGLPPSLTSKAEELRQQDALYRIKRATEDTNKLKTNDLAVYEEGVQLLEAETQEDERARAKYGTDRWTRAPSKLALAKLYQQSSDLQKYLNSAASSDTLVQTKIRETEDILRILTGTNRDLESYVPSSHEVHMTWELESVAANLRSSLNEISRLESQRKRKIDALRTKAREDDINPSLLTETSRLEREYPMQKIEAAQFEPLFETRLEERYESDRSDLTAEQETQDQIIARLRENNKTFLTQRSKSDKNDSVARERALQDLETGYMKYKEIISNLDTGRKFYNDLAGHVTRFREAVRSSVNARRLEAGSLEAELDLRRMGISNNTNSNGSNNNNNNNNHANTGSLLDTPNQDMTDQQQDEADEKRKMLIDQRYQQRQQQQQRQYKDSPAGNAGLEPLTAPVPTRIAAQDPIVGGIGSSMGGVWNPDMGIRFGTGTGATSAQQTQTNGSGVMGYPQTRRRI